LWAGDKLKPNFFGMTQDTQEAIRKLKALMEALKKQAQSKEPEPKLPQEQKVKEGDHGVLTELYPDMEILGKLFGLAKAFDINEVTVYIRDNGLITNFMDRTHVMLVDMKMTWQLFSKSEFQKGVIDHFTLRTNETINLLKRLEDEDVPICMVIDPSKLKKSASGFSMKTGQSRSTLHFTMLMVRTGRLHQLHACTLIL